MAANVDHLEIPQLTFLLVTAQRAGAKKIDCPGKLRPLAHLHRDQPDLHRCRASSPKTRGTTRPPAPAGVPTRRAARPFEA